MEWKIPLTDVDVGHEEIRAVTRVLQTKWLTMNGVTEEFEHQFAERVDVKYAFAVTNCTAALHLANLALDIGPADEVICPALTFVATANAARFTGATVAFADSISETDLTVDPVSIEEKITEATKAITVVHYAGFPCNMAEVLEIAARYDLKIIEDCAHAPLAWCRLPNGTKKYVGSIGDVGCFSFFGTKNMTTGEGGMITTNDEKLARRIALLRSHGMTSLTYDRHRGRASSYDVVALGYNYRTDEMRSALGIAQLRHLEANNQKRREVYKWYAKSFGGDDNITIPFADRNIRQATPHIMPVIVRKNRTEIRQRLKNAGIQTSKHYDLIPQFTLYKRSPFKSSVENIENILSLPMYPGMKKEDVLKIREAME